MSLVAVDGVRTSAQPRLRKATFPITPALLTGASVGQPLPVLAADHAPTATLADAFVLLAGILVAGIVSTVRVAKGQLAVVGEKGHYRVIPPGVHYRSLLKNERVVARVNQKDVFTIQVQPGEGHGLAQGFLVKIHYEIDKPDPHVVSTLIEGTDERGQLINALKADVMRGLVHWSDPSERTVGSTKINITDDKRPNYVANHINGKVGSKLKGEGLKLKFTEVIAL
jgi:hypothetical protein